MKTTFAFSYPCCTPAAAQSSLDFRNTGGAALSALALASILNLCALESLAFTHGPTADPAHEHITEDALRDFVVTVHDGQNTLTIKFLDPAINEVKDADVSVDSGNTKEDPHWHFDCNSFQQASTELNYRKEQVILYMTSSANGAAARLNLGMALHTLQDFYSHSSWLETGHTVIWPKLGREVIYDPPSGEIYTDSNNKIHRGRGNFTYEVCAEGTLFTDDHQTLGRDWKTHLTTGWYNKADGSCHTGNIPPRWVLHGYFAPLCEGINKDYPGRDSQIPGVHDAFGAAKYYATQASKDFLQQIFDDARVRDNLIATLRLMHRDLPPPLGIVVDLSERMSPNGIGSVKGAFAKIDQGTHLGSLSSYVLQTFAQTVPRGTANGYTCRNGAYDGAFNKTIFLDYLGFYGAIQNLNTVVGGICPTVENCAFYNAVNSISPGGEIRLFSNGTPKPCDKKMEQSATALAREKNIYFRSYLTGSCPANPPDPDPFHLHDKSGGILFLTTPDVLANASLDLLSALNGNRAFVASLSGYLTNHPDCSSLTSGIVSWWPGDADPGSIIGSNDGTLYSGATYASGKVDQGFGFDGVGAYFQASADALPTGSADRTLELWVNIEAFPATEAFIAGYGSFGTSSQAYSLGTLGNSLFFSQWDSGVGGPALATNTWYHIAVTSSSNSATLYLNGAAVGSGAVPINTASNSQFYMGRIPGSLGDTRRLQGQVDEIAVFDRALSASEIAAIYNAGAAGKCKPIHKKSFVFPVNPDMTNLTVVVSSDQTNVISFISPSGVNLAQGQPGVEVDELGTGLAATIQQPETGNWTVRFEGSGHFSVAAQAGTPLSLEKFQFLDSGDIYPHGGRAPIPGDPVNVTNVSRARLYGGPTNVSFRLITPDGQFIQSAPMAQFDLTNAPSEFVGTWVIPMQPFKVIVTGFDSNGFAFQRAYPTIFQIQPIEVQSLQQVSSIYPGIPFHLEYMVRNLGAAGTFDVSIVAATGVITNVSADALTLGSGETNIIEADIIMPADAETNVSEFITVVVSRTEDATISNSAVDRQEVLAQPEVKPMVQPQITGAAMLANSSFGIQFESLTNRIYYVQYSPDLQDWQTIVPELHGNGGAMAWADVGPPLTDSLPATTQTRFYRIVLTPY